MRMFTRIQALALAVVMLLTMLAAGSAAYRFGKIRMLGVALLLMAAGLQISGAAGSFAFLLAHQVQKPKF